MRFLIQISLIALACFLSELIFPWWTAAVSTFVVTAVYPNSGFRSFLAGFLGVGLMWLFTAIYFSISTDYILTEKVADLMQMGRPGVLIVVTAFIGAIIGGMAGMTGSQLHRLLKEKNRKKGRYHSDL